MSSSREPELSPIIDSQSASGVHFKGGGRQLQETVDSTKQTPYPYIDYGYTDFMCPVLVARG